MMTRPRFSSLRFLPVLALLLFGTLPPAAAEDAAKDGAAAITTASGVHPLDIEVADTPQERETGLMFRKAMAPDHGMLFDFGETRTVMMWMKNTILPLDMVFLDASGRVTHVAADAVPFSLDIIPSGGPARYVVELNAGTSRRLGISEGDAFRHPLIKAE